MDKVPKYTPEELYQKFFYIGLNLDTEEAHLKMDELMCELLESFGYGLAVELFREIDKWYA